MAEAIKLPEQYPHEPAYLIERTAFQRRHEAIISEGLEMGFLVNSGDCSECAGDLVIDTSTMTWDWIRDEDV